MASTTGSRSAPGPRWFWGTSRRPTPGPTADPQGPQIQIANPKVRSKEDEAMRRRAPRTALALGSGVLATVLLLSGCTSSGGGSASGGGGQKTATVSQADIDKAMKKPTTLTFWTWVPDIKN